MRALGFVWTVFGVAAGLVATAVSFNVVVDPYLVFNRSRVPGFNAMKPAVETHEALMKSYQASRVFAQTVVMGSSRTALGIDPQSGHWPDAMRPVYNLGLVGAGVPTSLRFLRGTFAARPVAERPHLLIVGLEFESFLRDPAVQGEALRRNEVRSSEQIARFTSFRATGSRVLPGAEVMKDYVEATLSLDSLVRSVTTITGNLGHQGADISDLGLLSDAAMRKWTLLEGAEAVFRQTNENMAAEFVDQRRRLRRSADDPIWDFEDLGELLALAKERGFSMVIFVQPSHASRLELFDAMGYWPEYEVWKRALAERVAQATADGVDVELYDFGGFESFAVEQIPVRGTKGGDLQWFWDPVHYRRRLGERIISTIMGQDPALAKSTRVDPAAIDAHLDHIRISRDRYRELFPALHADARRIVCAFARGGSQSQMASSVDKVGGLSKESLHHSSCDAALAGTALERHR